MMEADKQLLVYNQLIVTIDKWMAYLNDYTLAMLCQKPDESSWSLGQVYNHIISDTTYYVDKMKAALSSIHHANEAMQADTKVMFNNNAFPNMALLNPSNDDVAQPTDKDVLWQALNGIKKEVAQIFSTNNFTSAKGKTEHPGLGFMNAFEWLQFAEMHMRHHFRQKQRIDKQSAFTYGEK